jgi:hypothetical protein
MRLKAARSLLFLPATSPQLLAKATVVLTPDQSHGQDHTPDALRRPGTSIRGRTRRC